MSRTIEKMAESIVGSLSATERAILTKRGVLCGKESTIHGRVFAVCCLPKHDEKTRCKFVATLEERELIGKNEGER